jgi:phospholipase D1/2
MDETPGQASNEIAKNDVWRMRKRIALVALAVVVIVAIVALWIFTPLREWIDIRRLAAVMARFADSPFAPFVMLAAFVVGGLIVMPVNVLITVTVLVFGPVLGAIYALVGCELSAAVLYEIGCRLPRGSLNHRFGARIEKLRARLAHHGIPAIAIIRIVPVAPYSIVSLVGGAMHIGRVRYLIGTAIGMSPGILVNALFIDRVLAAIERPNSTTISLLLLAAALALALIVLIRRRLMRRNPVG